MKESKFGGNFESGALSMNRESEVYTARNIEEEIPHIPTPGPKIGPDFLKNEKSGMVYEEKSESVRREKNEKEIKREKLEKIKEIILETDIDLSNPKESYRVLIKELRSWELLDDETRFDTNYYFNQKLTYLYNKASLKPADSQKISTKDAAFAGAISLHGIIEKLEEIERSGGNDKAIEEYLKNRQRFYLDLKESETEHLVKKEEILLDNLQNAQMFGAVAEKAARKLIADSLADISILLGQGSLKGLGGKNISMSIKDASLADDVQRATDFYFEINGKLFPVQVKCGNIDVRHGEDEKTQEFIMNNVVKLVGNKDKFESKDDDCYYKKKIAKKLNGFINHALTGTEFEKGFVVILPRGKDTMKKNGDVDEKVKKAFFDQFFNEIMKLDF